MTIKPFRSKFLLKFIVALSMVTLLIAMTGPVKNEGVIQTVQGPVTPDALGVTLSHEHLFSNFGLPIDETDSYDEGVLFAQVIPYMEMLHEQGVRTIFDYTTSYFGRRADMLRAMSDATAIRIVTNTGIYGAGDDRYVPSYAYNASAEELAQRWIDEAEKGIDGSGILPGFIKLAFDDGPPSDIDRKLFEAGLITHLKTGLLDRLLLSHDGDAYPAGEEIRPFEAISKELIPAMRSSGFPESIINQLLVENPGEAYAIRIRRNSSAFTRQERR